MSQPNEHLSALISISIVVYRPNLEVLTETLRCLDTSVTQLNETQPVQVTLIDNGHTAEWQHRIEHMLHQLSLPHINIEYISCPENPGYGTANNKAIMASTARYHLVLNPDAYCEPDCLKEALDYLSSHPNCLLLAPAVFYPNGERQYLCRKNLSFLTQFLRSFAPAPLRSLFKQRLFKDEYRDHDYSQPMHNVEFMTGCFMLMQTKAAQDIKGFDPNYFMYVEDADLTRRLLKLGDNIYYPKARIQHDWDRLSSKSLRFRWTHSLSCLRYWRKFTLQSHV